MRVARQIAQHLLGAGEWLFGIDDPVEAAHGFEVTGEGARIAERRQGVEELQAAVGMCGRELVQKQAAIQTLQDAHRQEEAWAAGDPRLVITGEATARHDHVHVRMIGQRLPRPTAEPSNKWGVQHHGRGRLGAEMAWIGRDGLQRLGRRFE